MSKLFSSGLLCSFIAFCILTTVRADELEPEVLPLWENVSLSSMESLVAINPEGPPPSEPEETPLQGFSIMSLSVSTPAEEISALADALGNDPVRIFNYVRNHIDYEQY